MNWLACYDAIAALPADGERSIGILDLDRFARAIAGEPHGEQIRAVEQPRIAGGGGEQHQLTDGPAFVYSDRESGRSSPSSDTRPTNSLTTLRREIPNMFG